MANSPIAWPIRGFPSPAGIRCRSRANPRRKILKQLREGIYFTDGKFFVTRVHIVKTQGKSTVLEIELHQGRNRELRRLFARVGHKVMSLERVTFGPLKLGSLSLGKCRPSGK